MKKLFITCILVGAFVPLFQNCGQQRSFGNGDPYESDPQSIIDIGPDYSMGDNRGLPANAALTGICSGTGLIKRVEFGDVSGKEMINIVTNKNQSRLISNPTNANTLSPNVSFSSTFVVKTLVISSKSVTIYLDISGSPVTEQLSCVVY